MAPDPTQAEIEQLLSEQVDYYRAMAITAPPPLFP